MEFICTKDHPWNQSLIPPPTRVVHPHAEEIGHQVCGWPAGDIVTYRCPNCGHEWEMELPQ